jgi:hypothetical protein
VPIITRRVVAICKRIRKSGLTATPRASASQPKAAILGPTRHVAEVPEADMHFASLGKAFQADGRGFSPIEGGLEGGGSVS